MLKQKPITMNSLLHLTIGLILLTIGFWHVFTFPNLLESLYMTLLVVLCNSIGGFQFGVGIAKALRGE